MPKDIDIASLWGSAKEAGNLPDAWPFSIPYDHQLRFKEWQTAHHKNIVILGPPQDIKNPGIRLLGPIVEMATTLEIMRQSRLPLPNNLVIFSPLHINAWANSGDVSRNYQAAEMYTQLSKSYFAVFHPNLPSPVLTTDKPEGIQQITDLSQELSHQLSPSTQNILFGMAKKHHQGYKPSPEAITGYLIAHYAVYQGCLPDYYDPLPNSFFLVPQSEATFHSLMGQEASLLDHRLSLSPALIAYSCILHAPHYYPHQGEPSLAKAAGQWPTRNILSRSGANGLAQTEIWQVIKMIEKDIGGKNYVTQLQKQVLDPVNLKFL